MCDAVFNRFLKQLFGVIDLCEKYGVSSDNLLFLVVSRRKFLRLVITGALSFVNKFKYNLIIFIPAHFVQ